MQHTERCLQFISGVDQLAGVLTEPRHAAELGVLIVVGGPQYRAGSHRLFVQLSRQLAAAGCAVLRFDHHGLGDATGDLSPFDALSGDIAAATDAMQAACPSLRHWVLLGLCDGASAALIYLCERTDPRVVGLCLLNPWVRSAATEAATRLRHYYLQRLFSRAFWGKLLTGRVGTSAIQGLLRSLAQARQAPSEPAQTPPLVPNAGSVQPAGPQARPDFRDRMLRGWQTFDGPTQLILSENDYTAKEFADWVRSDRAWNRRHRHPTVHSVWLTGADHTFSGPGAARDLGQHVSGWLRLHFPQAMRAPAAS